MFSTFSSGLAPSSDAVFRNPFPAFDGGSTPWDCQSHELFQSLIDSTQPATSNSASAGDSQLVPDKSKPGSVFYDQNLEHFVKNVSQDEPNRPVSIVEERKRRRMVSNRESARRSRMRKQKHLENLRNQVNWLMVENRELNNRLRLVLQYFQRVRTDNDRLRSEFSFLQRKLLSILKLCGFGKCNKSLNPLQVLHGHAVPLFLDKRHS